MSRKINPTKKPIHPNTPADFAAFGEVFFMVDDRIHPTNGNRNESMPKPVASLSSVGGGGGGGGETTPNSFGILS